MKLNAFFIGITVFVIIIVAAFIDDALSPVHSTVPLTIPSTLVISGEQWRVEYTDKTPIKDQYNNYYLGITDCSVKVIYILNDGQRVQERLLHEVLHAAVCSDAIDGFKPDNMFYNSDNPMEHQGIYNTAHIISEIDRRNPEFARWMGQP